MGAVKAAMLREMDRVCDECGEDMQLLYVFDGDETWQCGNPEVEPYLGCGNRKVLYTDAKLQLLARERKRKKNA